MLQSGSEQFRFGDMTEEHADVVEPARFGIGERRREKSLRLVVEMLDEKHAPDSGEPPACARRFKRAPLGQPAERIHWPLKELPASIPELARPDALRS